MPRGWTDSSVVKSTEFSSQYPCQTAHNHLETQLQRKRHPHDTSWEHLGPHVRNPSGYVPFQIKYNPLSLILGTNQCGGGYKKSDLNRETHVLEQQKELIIFLFFPNLNPPDSFPRVNNICKSPRIHRCPKPIGTGNWEQDIYNVKVSLKY